MKEKGHVTLFVLGLIVICYLIIQITNEKTKPKPSPEEYYYAPQVQITPYEK